MDPSGQEHESVTRRFATQRGDLSYDQLSDAIAPLLLRLLRQINEGAFADRTVSDDLVREFHREILQSILPEIAGQWRRERVQVGNHMPPESFEIPMLMREFTGNIQARLDNADTLALQIELLAYAEGELLTIHPFADFNGRTNRAFLSELMFRLDFPPVELSVSRGSSESAEYSQALASYDNGRLTPLIEFWNQRLEKLDE